jgi:hypothetical protein
MIDVCTRDKSVHSQTHARQTQALPKLDRSESRNQETNSTAPPGFGATSGGTHRKEQDRLLTLRFRPLDHQRPDRSGSRRLTVPLSINEARIIKSRWVSYFTTNDAPNSGAKTQFRLLPDLGLPANR